MRGTVRIMRASRASTLEHARHRGDEPHLLREVIRTSQVLMAGFSREIGMPASRLAVLRTLAVTDGGAGVMDLARSLGVEPGETTSDGIFTLLPCSCLGNCGEAPCMMVGEVHHGRMTPETGAEMMAQKPYYNGSDHQGNSNHNCSRFHTSAPFE